MRTLIGPSISYNLLRALCAGVTLNLIFLVMVLADIMSGGQAVSELSAARPLEATGGVIGFALTALIAPVIYVPVGLISAWIRRKIGDVSVDLSPGGFIKLFAAIIFGWTALVCLIIVMLGDPLVLMLKQLAPGLVPVERPRLWNPHLFIRVEGDPDEIAAARAEAAREYPIDRAPSAPERVPVAQERATPARECTTPSLASDETPDWREAIADVEDCEAQEALAHANAALDDATALVHPITAIDAARADAIVRAVARVREALNAARTANRGAQEPGVDDYVELLDAAAQQYEGIGLALGHRRLAEGARLIEAALARLEAITLKRGNVEPPSPQTLYLLACIYIDLGDRGAALRFARRAAAANPGDGDYRNLVIQIEDDIAKNAGVDEDRAPQKSGAGLGGVLAAIIIVIAGGAGFYLWQSSQRPVQAAAQLDPNHFEVTPYTAQQTIVAREAELNIRALPFARPDIPVLRETIAGEELIVTGLVSQPEGSWYQVRLANGDVGYFKASLAVSREEFLAGQATAGAEYFLVESLGGEVRVFVAEAPDALMIRTVALKPWYTGFSVDVNANNYFGDARIDVSYGVANDRQCTQYLLSEQASTTCGGFVSNSTMELRDIGAAIETIWRIPKAELTSGATVLLRFSMYDLNARRHAAAFDVFYSYRLTNGAPQQTLSQESERW